MMGQLIVIKIKILLRALVMENKAEGMRKSVPIILIVELTGDFDLGSARVFQRSKNENWGERDF